MQLSSHGCSKPQSILQADFLRVCSELDAIHLPANVSSDMGRERPPVVMDDTEPSCDREMVAAIVVMLMSPADSCVFQACFFVLCGSVWGICRFRWGMNSNNCNSAHQDWASL